MNDYELDKRRYKNKHDKTLRFLKYFRKGQKTNNKLMKNVYKLLCRGYKQKRGLDISMDSDIGGGLYLGHSYNITINPNAVIGRNVNIHKGATIWQENRGKRKGAPTIGDNVWIGINAAVVGNIRVGSNVMIAPNSFVNTDIPDNPIVFGNPCVIKHSDNATEGYINFFD